MLYLIIKDSLKGLLVSYFKITMENKNSKNKPGAATDTGLMVKIKTAKPPLYKVLLLNDDFTPMEFVVHVLEKFFNKDAQEATEIMMNVHNHGIGLCGVYTYEIAETKVMQVVEYSRKKEHPLQCIMEKE